MVIVVNQQFQKELGNYLVKSLNNINNNIIMSISHSHHVFVTIIRL